MHLNSLILLTEATVKEIYDRYYSKYFLEWHITAIAALDPFSIPSYKFTKSSNIIRTGLPDKIGPYAKWLLRIAYSNIKKLVHTYNTAPYTDEKIRIQNFMNEIEGWHILNYLSYLFDKEGNYLIALTETFEEYDRLKKTKSFPDNLKDINKFRSIDEFLKAINEYLQKSIVKKITGQETEYPYEDSEWKVITPLTHRSSCYWVPDRNFCTAYENDAHFKGYFNKGKLYVFKNKKDKSEIYQLFVPFPKYEYERPVEFKNKKNKSFLYHSVFPEGSKIDEFIRSIGYNIPSQNIDTEEDVINQIINEIVDAIDGEVYEAIDQIRREAEIEPVDIDIPEDIMAYATLFGIEDIEDYVVNSPDLEYQQQELPEDAILVATSYIGGEYTILIGDFINKYRIARDRNLSLEEIADIINQHAQSIRRNANHVVDIYDDAIIITLPGEYLYTYVEYDDVITALNNKYESGDVEEINITEETLIAAIVSNGGKAGLDLKNYRKCKSLFQKADLMDIIDDVVMEVKKNPEFLEELHYAFASGKEAFLNILRTMKSQIKFNMMRNSGR